MGFSFISCFSSFLASLPSLLFLPSSFSPCTFLHLPRRHFGVLLTAPGRFSGGTGPYLCGSLYCPFFLLLSSTPLHTTFRGSRGGVSIHPPSLTLTHNPPLPTLPTLPTYYSGCLRQSWNGYKRIEHGHPTQGGSCEGGAEQVPGHLPERSGPD